MKESATFLTDYLHDQELFLTFMCGKKITLSVREEAHQETDPYLIIGIVCAALHISREKVLGRCRRPLYADVRKIICFILTKHTNLKQVDIALALRRDHSTVSSSLSAYPNLMQVDEVFKHNALLAEKAVLDHLALKTTDAEESSN